MRNRWLSPGTLLGIGILGLLIVLLPIIFQNAPTDTPTNQEIAVAPQAIQDSPLPGVTPIVITPETSTLEPPTPTTEPLPTAIPTPEVTPIPTIAPPYIEGITDQPLQPFWIYYWRENEIWRIDNEGKDNQLLLDTYARIGQYLTAYPLPPSDCCWSGARVVVSPDGKKLALVVVDKEKAESVQDFTFSIYVYDVEQNEIKPVSDGVQALWSPDGRQIAFLKNRGLWIADLETGEVQERITPHEKMTMWITEFAWSPDSTRIAFMYNDGSYQRVPAIWVVNATEESLPIQLVTRDDAFFIGGLRWSPDQQEILYLSDEGNKDRYSFHQVQNLWEATVNTGETRPLTQDMFITMYNTIPKQSWLYMSAFRLYERSSDANAVYDLWLLSLDGSDLRRLSAEQRDMFVIGVSSDEAHLLITDNYTHLKSFSLFDGDQSAMDLALEPDYLIGGPK